MTEKQSLNRTSVGLKPPRRWRRRGRPAAPQSNQRGIETFQINDLQLDGDPASIEPAWD